MNRDTLERSVRLVAEYLHPSSPACAIVLGSGWKPPANRLETIGSLGYAQIPALGQTSVAGHPGELTLARIHGREVLLFCGRRHLYEGVGWEAVAFPVYAARRFGAPILLLTCSAGGIASDLAPGELMRIRDHMNLMGTSPLTGPHDPFWGPRFPDQGAVYDPLLLDALHGSIGRAGLAPHAGVYAAVPGPTYETPAEATALRALGADAVGMSVVPEAMLGHAAGLRVAAMALISNRAAGPHGTPSHDEVLRVVAGRSPLLSDILLDFVSGLP
jgi:inosine/guanosine/xanthosine phosphorylase family protein